MSAARVRALAAINRVRRGKSPTVSAAAKAERTTVATIRRWLPATLRRDRAGRLRVKTSDRYAARVEILTDDGVVEVTARSSRERQLAGRRLGGSRQDRGRRVDIPIVLKRLRDLYVSPETRYWVNQPTALAEFRGKTVGGHELLSDPDRLTTLLKGGALDRLRDLYVSPETR